MIELGRDSEKIDQNTGVSVMSRDWIFFLAAEESEGVSDRNVQNYEEQRENI